jgi:hypothetical protein
MTELKRALPVEPLSDAAWHRIETEVFAELNRAPSVRPASSSAALRRRYLSAMAVAALALTAALLWTFGKFESPPPLTSRLVTSGDMTRTSVGDVTIDLARDSALLVTGNETGGFEAVLEYGTASFAVPERGGRAPFRVRAADVRVEVVGTRFTVWHMRERVRVAVSRGTVRVAFEAETLLLREGGTWSSAPSSDTVPEDRTDAPRSAARAATTVEQPPSSLPSQDGGAVQERAPSPVASRIPSARERYEAASKLERAAPDRAVASYLALAKEQNAWAANALYAAARLELERGRREQARSLLGQYLKRFPKGPNAEEARSLLDRTQK